MNVPQVRLNSGLSLSNLRDVLHEFNLRFFWKNEYIM
jgi:hypothetical protein